MLQHYLSELKTLYQNTDKLKKHSLLRSTKWTKSGYELLSDLIGTELSKSLSWDEQRRMGSSVSGKTLQNFFEGGYRLSYPIDPRTLNTLNKLVRFVGHNDWDSFTEKMDEGKKAQLAQADDSDWVENVVREAVDAEFRAYGNLPKVDLTALKPFYTEGVGLMKIQETLGSYAAQNWSLNNPFNPSTVEVLDLEVVRIKGDYAQVKTREFWLLCWFDAAQGRYVRRFKDINEHFYILTKNTEGGVWRIKTNASLAELNGQWREANDDESVEEDIKPKKKVGKLELADH